jgi:hypothetical protein
VAPVALAGAIIPGVARFIVVLSAQADVFGVGTTVIVGSRLVATSCVIQHFLMPHSRKSRSLISPPLNWDLESPLRIISIGRCSDSCRSADQASVARVECRQPLLFYLLCRSARRNLMRARLQMADRR